VRFSLFLQIKHLQSKRLICAPVHGHVDDVVKSHQLSPLQAKFSALLLSLLLLPWTANAGTLSVISKDRWVHVARVYDGDTFRTTRGERVRLLGINTPEIAHNRQREQIMGHEAAIRLQQLITGKIVRISFDKVRQDDYGRTLAHIYLRDNSWVDAQLVREGLAHVYTFEPNHRWTQTLLVAERQARAARIGIWSTDRFRVLAAEKVTARHIGQFRLITGAIEQGSGWNFRLGRLHISVPQKYRKWFKRPLQLTPGRTITVRGVIRASRTGNYNLALHSPFDVEYSDESIQP